MKWNTKRTREAYLIIVVHFSCIKLFKISVDNRNYCWQHHYPVDSYLVPVVSKDKMFAVTAKCLGVSHMHKNRFLACLNRE